MGIELQDGARVAVIGGGPAGSLFAYFALTFAQRMHKELHVDIYEPRDFFKPGPGGCNMCGGIVSESLVQALAVEGLVLPTKTVQRGVDSYVLHSDDGDVEIATPLEEKRIAAVHRGGGPKDVDKAKAPAGLDGFLLSQAMELGANVVKTRVREVELEDGKPVICVKKERKVYDLLVGATGVNSKGWAIFEKLGLRGKGPATTQTYVTEIKAGAELISERFSGAMHLFLLELPRVDFAAIIPKGEYLTVCLLGHDIDRELIDAFFASEPVKRCFPATLEPAQGKCHCQPKMNTGPAEQACADRVVLVGDCAVARLHKDGIGSAYRTAKAAARTAVFHGVSELEFRKKYLPTFRRIKRDNRYGWVVFNMIRLAKVLPSMSRAVLTMAAKEQKKPTSPRRMSIVLWDMFTGSASYKSVFFRMLDPRFMGRFMWEFTAAVCKRIGGVFRRRKRERRQLSE